MEEEAYKNAKDDLHRILGQRERGEGGGLPQLKKAVLQFCQAELKGGEISERITRGCHKEAN